MWIDKIVEETRKAREEHAARFNYDLEAIYRDLKEEEKKSGRRVISLPPNVFDLCIAVSSNPAGSRLHEWTYNDADPKSCCQHPVPLSESPFYLRLLWRTSGEAQVYPVGIFKINLRGLLEAGYVNYDPVKDSTSPNIRLRIVHSEARFFIQSDKKGPRLLMQGKSTNT